MSGPRTGGTAAHFFAASNGQLALDGCVSNDGSGGHCTDIPGAARRSRASPIGGRPERRGLRHRLRHRRDLAFLRRAGRPDSSTTGASATTARAGPAPTSPAPAPRSPVSLGVAVAPSGAVYAGSSPAGSVSHFFAAPGGQITFDGCVSNDGSGGTCADVPGAGTPLTGARLRRGRAERRRVRRRTGRGTSRTSSPRRAGRSPSTAASATTARGGPARTSPAPALRSRCANVAVGPTGAVYAASPPRASTSRTSSPPRRPDHLRRLRQQRRLGRDLRGHPGRRGTPDGLRRSPRRRARTAAPCTRSAGTRSSRSRSRRAGRSSTRAATAMTPRTAARTCPGAPLTGANDVARQPRRRLGVRDGGVSKSITHFFRTQAPGAGGTGRGWRWWRWQSAAARALRRPRRDARRHPGQRPLTGTAKADVIVGLGGKDTIKGLGGNDMICGGAGRDRLSAAGGTTSSSAGPTPTPSTAAPAPTGSRESAGADVLRGGAGKDRLVGGAGKDRCWAVRAQHPRSRPSALSEGAWTGGA